MANIIKNLKLKAKRVSIVLPKILENVIRAGRNIPNLNLMQASQLNTYEVLNGGQLIFMEESVSVVKNTFLGEENEKPGNAGALKRRKH